MDITRKFHFSSYPAISPQRPELSQAGRTILITGGGSGIGLAISTSFAQAGAAHIILVGRRREVLEKAKHDLLALRGSGLKVSLHCCDIADVDAIQRLWDTIETDHVKVDVLVLNAASLELQSQGLDQPGFADSVWSNFQGNINSTLRFIERFHKNAQGNRKVLVSVNSGSAHIRPCLAGQIGYSSSKIALASMLQGIADTVKPEDFQIMSFHPGGVLTDGAKKNGADGYPYPWNDAQLPGDFAVWMASEEASFLHGRFLWCHWDVEEVSHQKERFEQDHTFCYVGLQGPTPVEFTKFFGQVIEEAKKCGRM